jgi:hypothetical protein
MEAYSYGTVEPWHGWLPQRKAERDVARGGDKNLSFGALTRRMEENAIDKHPSSLGQNRYGILLVNESVLDNRH